jgi:hypothetical protein
MMISKDTIPTTSILSAVLLFATSSIAGFTENAFASTGNATMTNGNATSSAGTAAANASKLNGVIASMQLDENGNPAWITAGHWNLESDAPLIGTSGGGNQTEPQVTNFTATIYMVRNEDGTAAHTHDVSNFTQTGVTHQGPNSTTVNGTFTITLEQGPVNDVSGYVHVINDKIEFWVDPVATDNHFGPTTITGIVLTPEKFGGGKVEWSPEVMTTPQQQ